MSRMYLRRCYRAKDGKRHAYWALVKSVRTVRRPRQQVVAYLGEMDEAGRVGIRQAAQGNRPDPQGPFFEPPPIRWNDWTGEELWRAYMQLAEGAEGAFRIQKSDLDLRPIWHQKPQRVKAHILVCFLTYVIWKTLGQMWRQAGLGDEPRKVLEEIGRIPVVDVVMPTSAGIEIRKRCVQRPTARQAILLERLGLHLPECLERIEM